MDQPHDPLIFPAYRKLGNAIDGHGNERQGDRARAGLEDPFDAGFDLLLANVEQLFVKLLARSQSNELNGNVLVRLETVERDHASSEIDDPDRIAHIEHENRSSLCLGFEGTRTTLQDQLHRFAHGHEKSLDVRVSDRQGPPLA